jgi:hypothetical protein
MLGADGAASLGPALTKTKTLSALYLAGIFSIQIEHMHFLVHTFKVNCPLLQKMD